MGDRHVCGLSDLSQLGRRRGEKKIRLQQNDIDREEAKLFGCCPDAQSHLLVCPPTGC